MISLLIPIYNEESNIAELAKRIVSASRYWKDSFEVIFIDDGSSDRSVSLIRQLHEKDPRFKCLSLSRNFGHQAALTAGMRYAKGKAVAIMDADLQDPPEVLGKFLKKWRAGYEVVYAIRRNRKESWFMRLAYHSFYRILSWASEINIPLDAGDFCVMDKKVVDALNSFPERNRFLRGLRSWTGYRQIGVVYNRHKRYSGRAKYNLPRLFKLAFDGILSFSYKPIRIFGVVGIFIATLSFIVLCLFVLSKVFSWNLTPYGLGNIPGYFPLLCILLLTNGIQLMGISLFGEYLGRTYDEAKARPHFIIKDTIGFSS